MKTRNSSRLAKSNITSPNEIDLATEFDIDDVARVNANAGVHDKKAHAHVEKIGDVGYTFQKYFDVGWYNGKVVEIRLGAANGKNRRCVYEDGDVEDLSVAELKALAFKASKLSHTSKISNHSLADPKTPCPEKVKSSNIGCTDAFDENDYGELYRRYLTPRILENVDIPRGMTLRRQYRDRMIDKPTDGFKKLRHKIDFLLKTNERKEVYKILSQLRNWEMNPSKNEVFRDTDENDEDAAREYVNLTNDSDDKHCIDVDKFILKVPLVDVKQHHCDDKMETNADLHIVSCSFVQQMRVVKREHAEEGVDDNSQTQTSKLPIFQPAAMEQHRFNGAGERDCESNIVSPALNYSSPRAEGRPSELFHIDAPSNLTVAQIFTPIRIANSATSSIEGYMSREIKSTLIVAQRENVNCFDMRNKDIVQVMNIGQVDQTGGPTIGEEPFQSNVFNLRKISSESTDDQFASTEEFAKVIDQGTLGLDESRTNNPQKNPPIAQSNVPTTDTRRIRMFLLGNLPPATPQIDTLYRRAPYSSHSMMQSTHISTSSSRALANAHSSPSVAMPKLYRWHFAPYILALQRREPVSNKVAEIKLRQQSEVHSLVPPYRTKMINEKDLSQRSLADGWRDQSKRRRQGEWMPQGRLTGKWKAPQSADGTPPKERKPTTCKKDILHVLKSLVNDFISCSPSPSSAIDAHLVSTTVHLKDLICPFYVKPTPAVLKSAHHAIESLLPKGDCESFDVIEVARKYYDYWRPAHGKTKVILLAESHAFTEKDHVINGPRLDDSILTTKRYSGPREFLSLVYCLAYGESKALTSNSVPNNKGTPQFWSLLSACSRGVDYVATISTSAKQQTTTQFAADILKGGGLPLEERLDAKLKILEDLRERGVWLLDVSIFGWYIAQPQKYKKSAVTNEIHRMTKQRPPPYMKAPSLVLSFELFTKHLIREIAEEGNLQLIIPIGREVEQIITHKRLVDAVRIPDSQKPHARVLDAFPAPNAWLPGGYGPFYAKLSDLVMSAAPPAVNNSDDFYECN